MTGRLIFVDVDGTLTLPGSNTPSEAVLRAIQRAQERGNRVFLCTGRCRAMLLPLLKYRFDGYIASAGGYVVCGNEVLYDCPMTPEQGALTMSVLKSSGIWRTAECLNTSYTDENLKIYLTGHIDEPGNVERLKWRTDTERSLRIRPMREYQGEPIYKIAFMYRNEEQLREPERLLGQDFQFVIQSPWLGIRNGELINRKFDKGQAVRRICRCLNVDLADTIGFGDSGNDLEMLRTVGTSVCMGNAAESVQHEADQICPPVEEDGIAQEFQTLGLI